MATIRELKALQHAALEEYHRIYLECQTQIDAQTRPSVKAARKLKAANDPMWAYTDPGRSGIGVTPSR